MSFSIRPFGPADIVALNLQRSQIGQYGRFDPSRDLAHGAELAAGGPAWTGVLDGDIVGCAGFAEIFPGLHATAWAVMAEGHDRYLTTHGRILRFIRETVAAANYRRLEALARLSNPKELRWARAIGLDRVATLRAWGPLSEDYVLFERIA